MKKERTNLYLPSEVKKRAMKLADSSGMSLSVFITQLLIKEAAREQGFIKQSPAFYVPARSRERTSPKGI